VNARAPTPSATTETPLLSCREVTVAYGSPSDDGVEALTSVGLSVRSGEALALWGPSGSGKTTLLHVLGGLIEPSRGVVVWEGEPLSSLDATARKRIRAAGIAYVFQGTNLLPTFTAYENLAFAAYAAGLRVGVEERALELLTLVGLRAKADHLPRELSGGEAQRIAIARALAQHARLLLFDEPTGHLDTDTSARVLDLVERLHRRFGFTLVVATHDADLAASLDRVVELHDGKIVDDEGA
jgi:ABC-type lipoprotein export system ATPase subunit